MLNARLFMLNKNKTTRQKVYTALRIVNNVGGIMVKTQKS